MEFNLDSRVGNTAPTAGAQIDFADASTYNNATSLNVYDQRGQDVALTFYFQKSATDTWNVFVTANGTTVGGTALAPTPITTMTFPASGAAPTAPATPITLNIPARPTPTAPRRCAIPGIQLDLTSATQFGAGFGVTDMSQDGFAPGQLTSISDREQRHRDGALFQRPEPSGRPDRDRHLPQPAGPAAAGRQRLGPHASPRATPVLGTPGNGNFGVLQSGALEESNVDLTAELVNMITAQRIYQANAQTIKTHRPDRCRRSSTCADPR